MKTIYANVHVMYMCSLPFHKCSDSAEILLVRIIIIARIIVQMKTICDMHSEKVPKPIFSKSRFCYYIKVQ